MTDHLEHYRQMARSIRFFPPFSLTQPSQQAVAQPVTPLPVVDLSSRKTLPETEVNPDLGSQINPSEQAAALVHEAVSKPTVLPVTYTILENIGDRISRLAPPKAVKPIISQPKLPQPDPNWTPTYTSEPQTIQAETKKPIDKTHLEASAPATVVTEAPTVEKTPSNDSVAVVVAPVAAEETPDEHASTAVVITPVEVEETTDNKAEAAVAEPPEAEAMPDETSDDNTSTEEVTGAVAVAETTSSTISDADITVAEAEDAQAPTFLARISSAVEAATTAFKQPEVDQSNLEPKQKPALSQPAATDAPIANTVEPSSSDASPAETEDTQAPSLLNRVSAAVDAATKAFKQPEANQQDSEPAVTETSETNTMEPLTTQSSTDEAPTAQSPTLLERVSSVVESVTTTLKSSDVDNKDSESAEETTLVGAEKTSDSKTIEIVCPQCESTNLRKNGRRQDKQRYVCKECGKQFVLPDAVEAEDEAKIKENSDVKTAKVKGSESESVLGEHISDSKRRGKKKTKAKGFGDSKSK